MNVGSIDDLAWCVHEACERDLPPVIFPAYETTLGGKTYARPERVARPIHADHAIEAHSWDQSWSDTSLGMGGMAGQAICSARTTVVVDTHARVACVYVGRTLRGCVVWNEGVRDAVARHEIITRRIPNGTPYSPTPEPS